MTETKRRVGVYVCHCGGNISDVIDVQKVVDGVANIEDVVVARREMFMCSDPGQNLIAEDIAAHNLDRVVVAACSPSLHEATFRGTLKRSGLNPYLYEHVNIREQASWCHKDDPEGGTRKATRLVAAGIAKARNLVPLDPVRVPVTRAVAVVGGGIAGLRSAIDLAKSSFEVHVIERAADLGGHLARPGRVYPTDEPAQDLLTGLLAQARSLPGLTLHTETELVASTGYLGNFRLTLQGPSGEPRELTVGSIVLATGFEHYQPSLGELGFGMSDRVVTLPDFIERLDPRGPTGGQIVKDGKPVQRVVFIHCVGSRQLEGVHVPPEGGRLYEHCSRVCCTTALFASIELARKFPQVDIFDVYQDIRTYGRGQEDIYEAAARAGVTFFRVAGDAPPTVEIDASGAITVRLVDLLTFNEPIEMPVDLVVLVTGMIPRDITPLIEMFKLPRSPDGFLQEVHPKLRPVEVCVDGLFIAGACQAPMDVAEAAASASAASAKAACLLGGDVISLDPFVASIQAELCDGCGLCLAECVYVKALTRAEGETVPVVNTALCKGCGMCAAVCPHEAITVRGWEIKQYDAMVDAIVATGGHP